MISKTHFQIFNKGLLWDLKSPKVALSRLKSPKVALSRLKSILITQCYNGSLVLNCAHKEDIMQDNRDQRRRHGSRMIKKSNFVP